DAIRALVEKVREEPLVAVVGRSGSGKSSLVLAGLVPELRRQRPGVVWDVISLRPGAWPLHALGAAFEGGATAGGAVAQDAAIEAAVAHLRGASSDTLARILWRKRDTEPDRADRLLLYIDQWEELYSMGPTEEGEAKRRHALDVARFIDL